MGISAIYLIVYTSKHGYKMAWVAMIALSLVTSCCQYQFVLDLILLRYSTFMIVSSDFMTCLSKQLSYWNVFGSNKNLAT